MKCYVLGASGGVGRCVVMEALKRGHEVTVHGRQSSRLEFPPRVQVVRRELTSDGAFERIGGHDVVLSCIGNRRRNQGNPFSALMSRADLCESIAHRLVPAMNASMIRRVVAVSAAGCGDSKAKLNLMMKLLLATSKIGVAYADLEKMEQAFGSSGLDWFCVRPVTLTDKKGTGKISAVGSFGTSSTITRADVAHFMLDRVEEKHPFFAHTQQIANA